MIDISEPNDLAHRKCTGGGRKIRDTQRPPVGSGEERQPQKKAELRRIDFRPFRFLADKAAVAADFQLRKWRLLTWETENSKHSKCSYTCEKRRGLTGIFLQCSKQIW